MPIHKFPDKAITCAARAGFMTKEIWQEYIFSGVSEGGRNKAWRELLKRRYFRRHPIERLKNVYVLNRNNQGLMKRLDYKASNPPTEKLIYHDEVLLKGVLELEQQKIINHWTVEAELKSHELDAFQIGTSLLGSKYPDAILYLNNVSNNVKVAVEMELTQKEKTRYTNIMSSYSFVRELRLLLFVTSTPAIDAAVKGAASRVYFPKDKTKLGFMKIEDWRRDPATANIEMDGERMTLSNWVLNQKQNMVS